MAILVIDIPGLNGEYQTDYSSFTMREHKIIKDISGVRAGELTEALDAGDSDLIVALAVIGLRRRNILVDVNALWDAEFGSIGIKNDPVEKAEADAGPPDESVPEKPSGSDDGTETSGASSSAPGGVSPVMTLAPTGTQG